jgi:hypothetical protein
MVKRQIKGEHRTCYNSVKRTRRRARRLSSSPCQHDFLFDARSHNFEKYGNFDTIHCKEKHRDSCLPIQRHVACSSKWVRMSVPKLLPFIVHVDVEKCHWPTAQLPNWPTALATASLILDFCLLREAAVVSNEATPACFWKIPKVAQRLETRSSGSGSTAALAAAYIRHGRKRWSRDTSKGKGWLLYCIEA